MRKQYLFWLGVLCTFFQSAFGQEINSELPAGNYVVVGAYRQGDEVFVNKYVQQLKSQGYDARAGYETTRKYYYVYLNTFQNLSEALTSMEKSRQIAGFEKAWVRVIKGIQGSNSTEASKPPVQPDSNTNNPGSSNSGTENRPVVVENKPNSVSQPEEKKLKADSVPVTEVIDNPPASSGLYSPVSLVSTDVFLSVYDAQKNRVIQGEIEVVDTERGRLITKVKGNEYLRLPDPKSKTGQISLICNVFGYRRLQREISFPNPRLDEEADLFGNFLVVNFDMVRYQKGDIHTLYKVFFYNDAAVMLPESKYELNCLLNMMNDNPDFKIVLHGHSNGNARGKIILMGPEKDFFKLDKNAKIIENGTAKELSNQRAITIREWLLANGVAAERVNVKPWGGKRMLYDKMGVNAKKNIRVEVEILKD